jgi:two-component system NtrC family sensor kinase
MKKGYLTAIVLLLLSVTAMAQPATDESFKLNKLPQQDTIPTGWKIIAGNNPLWALPSFNDKEWASFNPNSNAALLNNNSNSNNFWLRLHLTIDSSLKTTDFAFMIEQNVASEIYLDGRLIKTYGTIGAQVNPYNPHGYPLPVKLSAGDHLIAVNIAIRKYLLKYQDLCNSAYAFNLVINSQNNAIGNHEKITAADNHSSGENLLLIGMFFILTVTHLASYLSYRKQKAHLYYAIITFLLFFGTYTNFEVNNEHSPVIIFWLSAIATVGFIGFVFLPLTIYELFDYRSRLPVKIILTFSALAVTVTWINVTYALFLLFYITPLVNAVECLRVGIWALKLKKSGAIFVISGSFLFLSLLVVANLVPGTWGEALFMLSLISLPIGMTVFLAIRTAITYRSLEIKIVEVQELSQQNMQFQLEKQQMLAEQNEILEQQVQDRTAALNQSLVTLKAAQNQLIQSEKMASLGELTAGIAHEIQNPLNFVNNFSEVNAEMIEELEGELKSGNINEALAIAVEIKGNEQKINHHGKRADSIVKGMLQHSRAGSGQKEVININALADEYLRLAYHGLRAKDKNFNAELFTRFEDNLPKINVLPQDIGRVLLNLFNNAFYAVHEKRKSVGHNYQPEVTVTTLTKNGQIIINVKDNGIGIPDPIKEKIMQPFFTTKPSGEGTGLGLSLSYDIVVKGHGGSINIDSKEGEYTEFVICIPV